MERSHSSIRRYFYGVEVQVLTTSSGIPVEFGFVPGSESDVHPLKKLPLSVAPESCIYADSGYTDSHVPNGANEADKCSLNIVKYNTLIFDI